MMYGVSENQLNYVEITGKKNAKSSTEYTIDGEFYVTLE